MKKIEIHQKACEVNKRRLVFDATVRGTHIRFIVDEWDSKKGLQKKLFINGKRSRNYKLIQYTKHHVQAVIDVGYDVADSLIFVDRAYRHNDSYNVYFEGIAYEIGDIYSDNKGN